MKQDLRHEKGKIIAERKPDQIRKINKLKFVVQSQTKNNEEHMVHHGKRGWVCTCNDFTFRHKKCKHVFSLEFRGHIKYEEKKNPTWIIPSADDINCPFCGSENFRKYGHRYNKKRKEHRYNCLQCHRKFCGNDGFKKLKYTPKVVTFAMNLYFYGLSMRNVTKSLKLLGVEISHMSVYRWIVHYVQLMQMHVDMNIVPYVGSTWRADGIFLKIKGRQRYAFMSMDDKTRFWISKEVANTKFHHDAKNLLLKAKEITKTTPAIFITDGSPVYDRAFRKVMRGFGDDVPIHINTIRLDGNHNNNMMERLNGEFRDREKVMRGIKKKDSSMISGYQLFHNYFRPHTSLGGQTPAEVAGIRIEGEDKWKTLIQNAQKEIVPKQYSITEFFGKEIKIPVKTSKDGEMSLDPC